MNYFVQLQFKGFEVTIAAKDLNPEAIIMAEKTSGKRKTYGHVIF